MRSGLIGASTVDDRADLPEIPDSTPERESRSARRNVAALAASLLALLVVPTYGVFKDRSAALTQEEENARDLAGSIQVHASDLFDQSLYSLRGIQEDIDVRGPPRPGRPEAALRAAMRYDPVSSVLGVVDADKVIAVDGTGSRVPAGPLLSAVTEAIGPAIFAGDIGLGRLMLVKESNTWYLPLMIRGQHPGEVIFALVTPQRLIGTSASVRLLEGGFVAFVTTSGERLFHYMGNTRSITAPKQPLSATTLSFLRKGGEGNYEAIGVLSHEPTKFAYSTSTKFPLAVIVGVPVSVLNAAWLSRSAGQIALMLGAAFAVIAFALRLRSTRGALRQSRSLYRDLFDSAAEGLLVLDRRGVVQTCNTAALRLFSATEMDQVVGFNIMWATVLDSASGRTPARGILLLEGLEGAKPTTVDWVFSKKNGAPVEVEMRLTAVQSHGVAAIMASLRDVGIERRYLQQQEYLASHDSLTGLFNRYAFQRRIQEMIDASSKGRFGVVLMDLNRFKDINDTLGHHAGDAVLKIVGKRLHGMFGGDPGFVARLGGDEIAICAREGGDIAGLDQVFHRLHDIVGQPLTVSAVQLELTASIGGAIYPDDAATPTDLLRCADIAMYVAKRELRAYQRYSETMDHFSEEALALQSDFARAIRDGGLSLEYQPKVELSTGELVGVEALARWVHPSKGPIPPTIFVPLAETTELIYAFTKYVLREALSQVSHWRNSGQVITVAVNISANNLMDATFVEMTRALLEEYDVPAAQLEFEVTESALMRNPDTALLRLMELRKLGIGLSLDDFGTGYASLAYLKKLPVDTIKIDKSFISELATDDADKRIVRSTIHLAHGFGAKVVAEGVETAEAAAFLTECGCDIAQGYFYSRPLRAEDLGLLWLSVM